MRPYVERIMTVLRHSFHQPHVSSPVSPSKKFATASRISNCPKWTEHGNLVLITAITHVGSYGRFFTDLGI